MALLSDFMTVKILVLAHSTQSNKSPKYHEHKPANSHTKYIFLHFRNTSLSIEVSFVVGISNAMPTISNHSSQLLGSLHQLRLLVAYIYCTS
jgi:hypothetical protein